MSRSRLRGRMVLAAMLLLLAVPAAHAIISAALPLDALLAVSQFIAVAKVEKVDAATPAVVLTIADDLKGKAPSRRMAIQLKGDEDARKFNHVPQLLKRLAPDLPVVLFISHRAKLYTAFAYTDGTWFQLIGQATGGDGAVAWSLTHGEPNLRQTFHGTTAELRQLLADGLAGKRKMPAIDKKVEPGFGPEVPAKGRTGIRWLPPTGAGGPLFGVIPTLGVGAPLMVLAALFPAVFGGVLLLFRQWIAFITVFSVNSTLLLLHWLLNSYWPGLLRGSWLGTDAGLWFVMTLVPLVALVWAWRRQLTRQALADPAAEAPARTERTVLWSLTGVFVVVTVLTPLFSWYLSDRYELRGDLAWASMLMLTLGVVAGTLYRIGRGIGRGIAGSTPALATEGVMIAAIVVGHIAYTAYRWGREDVGGTGPAVVGATTRLPLAGLHAPQYVRTRWQYSPPNFNGVIVAAPLVHGGEVYAAAAGPTFKQGTLFCLDRETGTQKWEFLGEGGDLKEMISGPVIDGGKLYMGEGFHDDPNCRLFCLNAADGAPQWAFKTTGQTECSPCVGAGRVYFGAGNDGIYCVDAAGHELWRFPPQPHSGRLLRCGATPALVGNRLYSGSAVDRNAREDPGETSIFCLDAETGKLRWKKATPLPAWAAPVPSGGEVIYALGNGDVFNDAEGARPAGRVLCVNAQTGDAVWHFDAPNGVLDRPAVDAAHVFFGCRDGQVYCLGRHDGKLRWKASLGAPVVAPPALASCPGYGQTAHVFAVAVNGKVACLDPATGDAVWSLALTDKEAHFSAAPRVVVSRTEGGDRRLIYVAGGVGGLYTGRPVVYCLEDFVKVE